MIQQLSADNCPRPTSEQATEHQKAYRTTRPHVTKAQSTVLAKKLFSLDMSQQALSEVKELESYEDRNFLIKGKLQGSSQCSVEVNEQQFVLKVVNSVASKNRDLQRVFNDLLPHISSKAIQCPVPQTSIFGTKIVICRLSDHESRASCIDNDNFSVVTASDTAQEASSEKENINDVCALLLLSFVHGSLLCAVEWTKELLIDFGRKMARLHKIFQEYSKANCWIAKAQLQHPSWPWTITNSPQAIMQYNHLLKHSQRQVHVQDIAKQFQDVLGQLQSRDLQLIHGDFNEHNVIVGHNCNGELEIKGFIDFNDMQYSHRVLDVGVALGYLMIESCKKNFDIIEACSHVMSGYQSEYPLTASEIDKLLVTAKARISQSLVLGAHQYQLAPDNAEYLLYTQKDGCKVLESLQLIPEFEILKRWNSF